MCCSDCALTPAEANGPPKTLLAELLSWVLPRPWQPHPLCVPWRNLSGSCCPSIYPCSKVPHLSPEVFNSIGVRPSLSLGGFWEGCSQLHCWQCVPCAEVTSLSRADGMWGKQHLHHPGKHRYFQTGFC